MSRCFAAFSFAVLVGWAALSPASATPAADFWRTQTIYQIATNRFFNGDTTNDNAEGN